jgi:hypothetical protein
MLSRSEMASRLDVFAVLSFAANSVLGSLGCGRTRLDGHAAAPAQSADSGIARDARSGLDATLDDVLVRDAPREFMATADAESDFDGTAVNDDSGLNNMCSANAPVTPPDSPVYGTFAGPNVDVLVCDGGVFSYLFVPTGSTSPYIELFHEDLAAAHSARFSIRQPQNVASVDFSALLGVSSTTPGTYTSVQTCGSIVLCLNFPIPAGLDCSTDAGLDCPPGCTLEGPFSGPTCVPVQPSTCYVAQGSSDCVSGTQTPMGSWQLTLNSIILFSKATGYVTHGSLTATMVGDQDATDAFSLSLEF